MDPICIYPIFGSFWEKHSTDFLISRIGNECDVFLAKSSTTVSNNKKHDKTTETKVATIKCKHILIVYSSNVTCCPLKIASFTKTKNVSTI